MTLLFRSLAIIGLLLAGATAARAQQMLVSTTPQNKNFLIEKGTGHVCGSCPYIERRCDSVLAAHPGRGMMVEYHFGPDALPQASPLHHDFTTPYGDTIYAPNKLAWPFYLNMMMNRRDAGPPYNSVFIFGPNNNMVQAEANAIVAQPSPVNLYLASTFNSTTRLLTVYVQAYYTTASATAKNYLQLVLTEDSIISTQYDDDYPQNNHFNPQFVFKNVFRANLNGFNGDTVNNTSAGRFISRTYTYTIPASYKNVSCNPQHCNLTFYMAEEKAASGQQSFTGKVITATRAKVGTGTVPTGVSDVAAPASEQSVHPNPTTGTLAIHGIGAGKYTAAVMDVTGRVVRQFSGDGGQQATVNLAGEPKGVYFIRVSNAGGSRVHRVVLAD